MTKHSLKRLANLEREMKSKVKELEQIQTTRNGSRMSLFSLVPGWSSDQNRAFLVLFALSVCNLFATDLQAICKPFAS